GTFWSTGNQELKRKTNKKEPIYTIKTYTHPITNFTNLPTMEGSKIEEELNGGGVISMCSCTGYQVDAGGKLCS
ncbi:hypothetical protein Anas_06805, partial [Armadillidium nasatum]